MRIAIAILALLAGSVWGQGLPRPPIDPKALPIPEALPFPRVVSEDPPVYKPAPPPKRGPIAPPTPVPNPIPPEILSPVGQLALVVADLAQNVRPEDAPFTWYLSHFVVASIEQRAKGAPKIMDLETYRRVFRFELNHVNASRGLVPEYDVPGSFGTLTRINIRRAVNWTRTAWEIVGNRDYLFREPWLPHRESEFVRLVGGVKQDPKTLAVVKIINSYQLFRDLTETNRQDQTGANSTYYDLLYAAERHPDGDLDFAVVVTDPGPEPQKPAERPWPGGPWTGEGPDKGKNFDKGAFNYIPLAEMQKYEKALAEWKKAKETAGSAVLPKVGKAGKGNKNFPETGADFERRWGAEVKAEDLKRFLIDPRFGGIALGAESDPRSGSFVALNDRAIRITKTPFGWSAHTYDVFENTGDRDHMERIAQIAQGKIAADAGEILASLPNGAQAALLVNGEDKRVEIANSAAAQIRNGSVPAPLLDHDHRPRQIDKFADVRTHSGCVVCHGASAGFIAFAEAVQESIKKGLEARTLDEKIGTQVQDFYTRWEKEIPTYQAPYLNFIQDATATPKEPKGWTPATTVKQFQLARDWYDLPVTTEVAAAEFGMTKTELQSVLLDLSGKMRQYTVPAKDGGERKLTMFSPTGKFPPEASIKDWYVAAGHPTRGGAAIPGYDPLRVVESVKTRINQLATDQFIPRRTWEVDVAFELNLILDSLKPKEERIKELVAPQLLEDAYKRFGIKEIRK